MHWGAPGWLVIAGIVVVAGACLHPSAQAAERFASLHFKPSSEADPAPALE
jgi:hypothetical protein